jgi:hypothetical protein
MKQENEIRDLLMQIHSAKNNTVEFDEAGIIAEYTHKNTEKSSLAIKILTILGGFLATLAFLGFFMVAGLYKSGELTIIFGGIAVGSSIWLNKAYDRLIIDTFSISLFACGLFLIGIGADQLNLDENILPLIFFAIGICTLVITQNFIISFISILLIFGSVLWLIGMHHSYFFAHAYMLGVTAIMVYWFLGEAKIISADARLSKLYNPVRMGLVIAFIAGLCLLSLKEMFHVSLIYPWISSVIIITGVVYVVNAITKQLSINLVFDRLLMLGLCLVILGPTIMAPGISGSLLIILLCFLVNYKTGFALGVLSLISFVSLYYYDLGYSLLTKSWMMMATGLLFLLIYLFTYKKLGSNEKV